MNPRKFLADLAERLVYFPGSVIRGKPSDFGIPYQEVMVQTRDGLKLHGWFLPGRRPGPGLLHLNGNAGNIGDRAQKVVELDVRLGLPQLIFDYRGYGENAGHPTEGGLALDAEAALAVLKSKLPGQGLVLYGESLGGAVAIKLATRMAVEAVILEGTFTSLADMAGTHYPWIPGSRLLMSGRYEVEKSLKNLNLPLLILHGEADAIAPVLMARTLFQASRSAKKRLSIFSGAGHNDLREVAGEAYFEAIRVFLEAVFPGMLGRGEGGTG